MISKVHSGHKHLYLHFPTDRNAPVIQSEKIAVYNSKVSYMKSAIKYMFFANGGAITTILLNFDINTYIKPLIFFLVGFSYAIFIPIFMYFNTELETEFANNNKEESFFKKTKKNMSNPMRAFILYIPMLVFIAGLFVMYFVFTSNMQ